MTALDVMGYLEQRKVRLTLTPELQLHWRAPKGVMTQVLRGAITACKEPLIHLLMTGEDRELPKGVSLPETDYSRFLTWQTGRVPVSAQLMAGPLPAPPTTTGPAHRRRCKVRPVRRSAVRPRPLSVLGNQRVCTISGAGCVWRVTTRESEWLASRSSADEGELLLC